MSVSMKDVDSAFQGAGQKEGLEIWRIENFRPIPVQKSSYGKFFTGDSYVILKTTSLKSGAFRHDIHYWLGKDTSQDEAGTAAFKTIELDAALGGRAIQYRELQGYETEKLRSYFKPCIIPQQGGVASGFKHAETAEHETRLFSCKGKHFVQVKEVVLSRSSLNHDDIFILDTKSKIFQFNGSNSLIQERAKALEVVQYIKDTYHEGKCEVAAVENGNLMADADAGEFWGFFGGFAPLPRKPASDDDGRSVHTSDTKLLLIEKGKLSPIETEQLRRDLLDTNKCYLLDSGIELYVWIGRSTSLEERKAASSAAEELTHGSDRQKAHIIRVIEGFESVIFRSKFDEWPETSESAISEDGRGKVAALLKRQGVNVKGLMKAAPEKEPQPHIDCTGNLQVWRVNGQEKNLLSSSDQTKLFSGECYVFEYSYSGEDKEEYLVGTWFGKTSVQEEQSAGITQANKMIESLKCQAVQARIQEGNEPIQFFSIFQRLTVYKGGISSGYKNFVSEGEIADDTYREEGNALFRVQGSGSDNMQAIQVEMVASSLNSSYCFILHSGSIVFTWSGSLTTSVDQELLDRQLDLIKPNVQPKTLKEGNETEQFWEILGGKSEYGRQKLGREQENDPHLFSCTFSKGILEATEIFNFTQDDLMTEDIFILDCHSDIYVWVGNESDSKSKSQALAIGEKFLEHDLLLEKRSLKIPIFIVFEGNEPTFFTRFFSWDSKKAALHGNSFQRKLTILKDGIAPTIDKPKRRAPISYVGRSSVPEKPQRSRSTSFSPDRVRVRGRSPVLNALAAAFENPTPRNLSTPPPVGRKVYPKSVTPDSGKLPSKSASIAALTTSFETPNDKTTAKPSKFTHLTSSSPEVSSSGSNAEGGRGSINARLGSLSIKEEKEEIEDEEGLPIFPYERLKTSSTDPVSEIDVTRREAYLSASEFKEKLGVTKDAFYKLPKWKQNKLKMGVQLF